MTFKSVNHLKATLFNGNLKPTQGINERRGIEIVDRFNRTNEINVLACKAELEFKQNYVEELVATSEMVHPKGNKRD